MHCDSDVQTLMGKKHEAGGVQLLVRGPRFCEADGILDGNDRVGKMQAR